MKRYQPLPEAVLHIHLSSPSLDGTIDAQALLPWPPLENARNDLWWHFATDGAGPAANAISIELDAPGKPMLVRFVYTSLQSSDISHTPYITHLSRHQDCLGVRSLQERGLNYWVRSSPAPSVERVISLANLFAAKSTHLFFSWSSPIKRAVIKLPDRCQSNPADLSIVLVRIALAAIRPRVYYGWIPDWGYTILCLLDTYWIQTHLPFWYRVYT